MKVSELVRARWFLGALLIAAAALFAIGAANEKSGHTETSVSTESTVHTESTEGTESTEPAAHSESTETSEKVLGLNLESTPLVVLAVAISLALAVATWLTNHKLALLLAGLFAIAFAVLDIAEFAHQVDKSATGLAIVAAVLAVLHLAAAFVAQHRGRKPTTI